MKLYVDIPKFLFLLIFPVVMGIVVDMSFAIRSGFFSLNDSPLLSLFFVFPIWPYGTRFSACRSRWPIFFIISDEAQKSFSLPPWGWGRGAVGC
jgi:hypothetical protein